MLLRCSAEPIMWRSDSVVHSNPELLDPRALTPVGPGPSSRSDAMLVISSCVFVISRYHECMTKQTTVRLPDDLAEDAETVARIEGTSVNALIVDALTTEIERVRQDEDFTSRAKRLLERDRELLDRLAR